jgi:hypothetical protein
MFVCRKAPLRDHGNDSIGSAILSPAEIHYRPRELYEDQPHGIIEIQIKEKDKDRITVGLTPIEVLLLLSKLPPEVIETTFKAFSSSIEADFVRNEKMGTLDEAITSATFSNVLIALLSSTLHSHASKQTS